MKTLCLLTIKHVVFPKNKDNLHIITPQASKSRNWTLLQWYYLTHSLHSDFIKCPNNVIFSYFVLCPDSNPWFCIAFTCFNSSVSFSLEQFCRPLYLPDVSSWLDSGYVFLTGIALGSTGYQFVTTLVMFILINWLKWYPPGFSLYSYSWPSNDAGVRSATLHTGGTLI